MASDREWRAIHIDEDLGDVSGRHFENELFCRCRVTGIAHARFIDCDLRNSSLDVNDLRKLIGAVVSLSCYTFDSVALSRLSFDAFLFLLSLTKGNDDKRQRLQELIDPQHMMYLRRAFEWFG